MISNNVIGIYEGGGGGGRIAAGGGLFAGGLIAAGLIAGGLFASGLNAAPLKRRRFQSPRPDISVRWKRRRLRPKDGDSAIADRHNARNDFSRRDRLYYQVSTVTVGSTKS